jgi:hypothetical protein
MKKVLSIAIIALIILVFAAPALAAPANVSNFAQLKAALTDATTTSIVFNNNIELGYGGAIINPAKSALVIDGNGYQLTGYFSSSISDTLRLEQNRFLKSITVQNMSIIGYNKYGVVYIPDSSTYSDITITYNKVKYTGAQLIAARGSRAVIRDCDIWLVPGRSVHPSEVAAAVHVRLEGVVNILKQAPQCKMELFHISGKGGGLTVAAGAIVNVSDNIGSFRCRDWGFIKVPYNSNYIRFEEGCKFRYEGNNVFQKGEEIDTIYIGKNTEINIQTYGDFFCENGLFAANSSMTIEEGASVYLLGLGNNRDRPAIWLNDGAVLTINKPKEVLIYNSYMSSSKSGLAIRADGCKVTTVAANSIEKLEFWSMNRSAYTSLSAPTRVWSNPIPSPFSAYISQREKKTYFAAAYGYFGSAPFNITTATLNNVNVIRINGGGSSKPAESKVIVICRDAATGAEIAKQENIVASGPYGPYPPFYTGTDYIFREWLNTSDTVVGLIAAGETKTIVYLYDKVVAGFDIEVTVEWKDADNILGRRPGNIAVGIFRNGAPFQMKNVIAITSGNQQKVLFENLDKYDASGKEYVYTVVQQPISNYITNINGYTIVNEIQK